MLSEGLPGLPLRVVDEVQGFCVSTGRPTAVWIIEGRHGGSGDER